MKKTKKIKILHGMDEIAGQGIYSVMGLRENGAKAVMATWVPDAFGLPCDITLKVNLKQKWKYPWTFIKIFAFFVYALFAYNVFHFHFGKTLLPNNLDVPVLKFFRKKIFFEFHGTDLRRYSMTKKINPYYNLDLPDNKKIDKYEKRLLRYATGVILHDEELLPYLPETNAPVHLVPLRDLPERFSPVYPDVNKHRLKLVHAPSHRGIKGTEYILKAVENLKKRYEIDFILVENMSHKEALEVYRQSDIVLDQLIIGTYGVLALEAMGMGKPVITYVSDDMLKTFPGELPVFSSTIYEIEQKLEELIVNGELRHRLGVDGRKYVEKYHDYKKNALLLLEIYHGRHVPVRGPKAFEEPNNLFLKK